MICLDAAVAYCRGGLAILPAHPTEKRPLAGKGQHGKNAPFPSEAQVRAACARAEAICILCGAVSGHVECIDFDDGGSAFAPWRDRVQSAAPDLVERLVIERSPSGGVHVVYRSAEPVPGSHHLATDACGKLLIETRGEGALFLCAPSPRYHLTQGKFTLLPTLTPDERETLLVAARSFDAGIPRLAKRNAPPCPQTAPMPLPGAASPYAAKALADEADKVRTAPEGSRNRTLNNAALKVGHYVASGQIGHADVVAALETAALEAGLAPAEIGPTIRSGLSAGLRDPKSPPPAPLEAPGVDLSRLMAQAQAVAEGLPAEAATPKEPDGPPDPGPFPRHLLDVPGYVSEVAEFCLRVAFCPQPVIALGGALCLQAVLSARKIADVTDNRTNIYVIGVAPASSGKDRPLKVNREILFRGNAKELEGACDFASDAGLLSAIAVQPAILFQVDEIGRMLRSCGDAKSSHLWNISSQLIRLFSLSESVYKGKAYADSTRNQEIILPCASLFGVTVGHHYYESLTRENLIDGLVARLIVLEGDEKPPVQKGQSVRPPDRLLEPVRWWKAFNPGGNLASEHPDAFVVPESPEAADLFHALSLVPQTLPSDDHIGRTLWGRAKEKACRLALVYAASRDRENMRVDKAAAEWACDVAVYTTRRMLYTASINVADSIVQKNKMRILRLLREAPGGKLTKSQLARRMQDLKGKEREELVADLLEADLVTQETTSTGGRALRVLCVRE